MKTTKEHLEHLVSGAQMHLVKYKLPMGRRVKYERQYLNALNALERISMPERYRVYMEWWSDYKTMQMNGRRGRII